MWAGPDAAARASASLLGWLHVILAGRSPIPVKTNQEEDLTAIP